MNIYEKLTAIQCEIKAPKNLVNSFGGYKYRNAEGILEAFKPYAAKYSVNLTVADDIVLVGERVYVKAIARIQDNESEGAVECCAFAREPLDKKGSDASQITGAASSYARKYALNGLLLLDDTKDPDTDEDTAKRKGMTAADMEGQKEDSEKTAEAQEEKIDATHWKSLQKQLKDEGVDPKDMMEYYGVSKPSNITYGMERTIINDLPTLKKEIAKMKAEKDGSESHPA